MGSTFIEVNEMEAPRNAYGATATNARRADVVSRSIQNSPGGFTADHQGNITENKTVTVTQSIASGQQGDVLKSARTQAGAPVEVITDDTVVSINGVTATARSAAKAGLLQKHPDGTYSEVALQKAHAPARKAQRVDPLSSDSRARLKMLENIVGQQNAENVMDRIIAAAGRGEGIEGVAKELADLGGVQPEATRAIAEGIASDLDSKMMRTMVQGTGMTQPQAEEMLDWSYKNLPKTHVAAMFAGALHGDTGAISVAFEKYRLSAHKQNNS